MDDRTILDDFDTGDDCPAHGTPFRKCYTFGSSMSAETEVCVFRRCGCAVAITHDPIGVLRSVTTYHRDFPSAAGVGKLRALDAAAKYR